jgi:hypothetical protein
MDNTARGLGRADDLEYDTGGIKESVGSGAVHRRQRFDIGYRMFAVPADDRPSLFTLYGLPLG